MNGFNKWMASNQVTGIVLVAFLTALLTSVVLGALRGPGPQGPTGPQGPSGIAVRKATRTMPVT